MIERHKKKKITLAEMMDLRLEQREQITLNEIKHAYELVKETKGPRMARLVLDMFGIKSLEALAVIRYDSFLMICQIKTGQWDPRGPGRRI